LGIHYYRPDPGVVHHFLDQSYLGWFSDVKKTVATIERFSKKDAASFMDIWTRWQRWCRRCLHRDLRGAAAVREKKPLLERRLRPRVPENISTRRRKICARHFEHPRVRAFIGFWASARYELDAPKTGYLIPAMIAWGVNPAALPRHVASAGRQPGAYDVA
jgi:phytoene dehydrogenase-like protein